MSYVGDPFKYDVFVSYGRANRVGDAPSPMRQWSVAFWKALKTELLGPKRFSLSPERTLRVFFDESEDGLKRMEFLTPQVRAAAASSAILLILCSEDYLASDWCRQELDAWDASQKALSIPGEDRIALVRMEPTDERLWPARLKDPHGAGLPGYWFHAPASSRYHVSLPFGFPIPDFSVNGDFQNSFLALLADLWNRLGVLKEELEVRTEAKRRLDALKAPATQLYLHGRSGQDRDWNQFSVQLRAAGFAVMPTEVDPIHQSPAEENAFYANRLNTMRDCDALLLMSSDDGSAFDADLSYITRRVRRSLEARGVALHPCALLNSVVQAARTANRRTVAEQLRLKWIDTYAPWVPAVHSWLEEVASESGSPM